MRRIKRFPRPSGLPISGWTPGPLTPGGADARIPSDNRYYVSTFGGGSDTQGIACAGRGGIPSNAIADGTWWYIADSDRFGCGTRVRLTDPDSGRSIIVVAADVGPAQWVETRSGGPIIDASPTVLDYLFGSHAFGGEDHKVVIAEPVPSDTPVGPEAGVVAANDTQTAFFLTAAVLAGLYWWASRPTTPFRSIGRVRRER